MNDHKMKLKALQFKKCLEVGVETNSNYQSFKKYKIHVSYLNTSAQTWHPLKKEADGWLRANAEEIKYYTCILWPSNKVKSISMIYS